MSAADLSSITALVAAFAQQPDRLDRVEAMLGQLLVQVAALAAAIPEELLDAKQAAPMLGLKGATALRKAEERGSSPVPAIRVGRRLRWSKRAILEYVAGQAAQRDESP